MRTTAADLLVEQAVLMQLTADHTTSPVEKAQAAFHVDATVIAIAAMRADGHVPTNAQIDTAREDITNAARDTLTEAGGDGTAAVLAQQKTVQGYQDLIRRLSAPTDMILPAA